ncbi:nuclear transport factor 2 family protein [Ohtaekwangia kribbensis]|jgi:hypothetical protein|uniref:Nuclear transport factor 2 family protein n=1 Tax=Ohtaekwangia kribbensis TaxID=688913 RepID=A0ABW3JVT6_9BACT
MTLDILNTKEELRNLIDAYAYLGDAKNIAEQMKLFTPDAIYKVYIGDLLAADVSGTKSLEKEFNKHASEVKTYFTMNGQHTVSIDGDTALGVSFSQLKMIRESGGKNIITDYSVKYDDKYIYQNGKWLIKQRFGYFLIIDARPINN